MNYIVLKFKLSGDHQMISEELARVMFAERLNRSNYLAKICLQDDYASETIKKVENEDTHIKSGTRRIVAGGMSLLILGASALTLLRFV